MGYYSHTLFFSNKKKNQGKFGPIFSGFEPQNYSYFVLFYAKILRKITDNFMDNNYGQFCHGSKISLRLFLRCSYFF